MLWLAVRLHNSMSYKKAMDIRENQWSTGFLFPLLFFSSNCIIYLSKIHEIIKIILYRAPPIWRNKLKRKNVLQYECICAFRKILLIPISRSFCFLAVIISELYVWTKRKKIFKTFSYICFLIYIRKHGFLLF